MALLGLALCFLVPATFGTLLVLAARLAAERVAAVAMGAAAGLAVFTTGTYGLSLVVAPSPLLPAAGLAALAVAAAALAARSGALGAWRAAPLDRWALAFWLGATVALAPVAAQTLVAGPAGWATGLLSAYGDVAFHAALATEFAARHGFPPENPIFAGTVLSYPFLSDFFTSLLLDLGNDLVTALDASAAVLAPLVLATLYSLTRELTGSRGAALLAGALFVLGGATLGFIGFFHDLAGHGLSALLAHWPDRDYAGSGADPDGYHFINPYASLLFSQRALLLGMPLALTLVLAQLRWLAPGGARRAAGLVAGLLAGMLPLFHPHTVLALVPLELALVAASLAAARARGEVRAVVVAWAWFAAVAVVVGLPEVGYYLRVGVLGGQLSAHAWWQATGRAPLVYWVQNTGLLLPLTVLALALPAPRAAKLAAAAGLVVFAAANTWQFARWSWDNYKLFVYWLVLTLPLVGWLLSRWLRGRTPLRLVAALVLLLQGFSGGLDLLKVLTPLGHTFGEWDPDGVALADRLHAVLPSDARIVIAPIHNSPVFLAGVVAYLGYPAHVWSHGYNPDAREAALKGFYQGATEQLPEARAGFVLVGPAEQAAFAPIKIRQAWRAVATQGPYTVYALPPPLTLP